MKSKGITKKHGVEKIPLHSQRGNRMCQCFCRGSVEFARQSKKQFAKMCSIAVITSVSTRSKAALSIFSM